MKPHLRWAIVPKSLDAMRDLDFDQEKESEVEKWSMSDDDFFSLWRAGVFKNLGNIANIRVDDFEDCKIVDITHLRNAENYLTLKARELPASTHHLRQLIKLAIAYKTGLFLFL